ncbi:LamG domain-containing protein [Candidatus Pelagibacter sp.]|nr:hypothetical protein [Candidatus Pelagibacter sp.]MDA9663352.1 LamG domain-containing protein [Candidatus Pelagibacter sp.]
MTRARDIANLLGTNTNGIIDNAKITLDAAEVPNLAASKITSGTFADARIAASNVSQHASSFDDNKIVNDISTLALRQASNENKVAYNTNSMFVDVFQDATGIASNTNAPHNSSEYVSSVTTGSLPTGTSFYLRGDQANGSTTFTDLSTNAFTITNLGSTAHSNDRGKIGSTSIYFNGSSNALSGGNNSAFHFGTGEFKIDMWVNFPNFDSSTNKVLIAQGGWGTQTDYAGWTFYINSAEQLKFLASAASTGTFDSWYANLASNVLTWSNNTWYHVSIARNSNGEMKLFRDGQILSLSTATNATGGITISPGSRDFKIGSASDNTTASREPMYLDNILVTKGSGSGRSSSFTPDTTHYGDTTSATGNFISNAITAPSSVSKIGAIVTYQNQAGTNTLNTDIVLQLSADNGSNFTTATLTAMPDFATGIKMAKVNDLSVTAGTQLKYKISFANQSGSKEARIRGVSLQY